MWLVYTTHHHHHVVLPARISLTLSRHFLLSFIASGRSSGLHPVSSQSCWMYVRAGCPAFARPFVGVYKSTSLMSSSLCYIVIYTFMHHNDTTSKTDAWRKTPEGRHRKISLTTFYLSFYCKGSKGLFKVCMWEVAGNRT